MITINNIKKNVLPKDEYSDLITNFFVVEDPGIRIMYNTRKFQRDDITINLVY